MLITEIGKFVLRTADIQRAGRFQGRHENAFFRAENLGGLAHELDPGHDQSGRRVLLAEAGHFQGIGHAATGFFRQGLNFRIGIVVGHQYRVALA